MSESNLNGVVTGHGINAVLAKGRRSQDNQWNDCMVIKIIDAWCKLLELHPATKSFERYLPVAARKND